MSSVVEETSLGCPSWCIGDHDRAIAEGCDPTFALQHVGADLVGVSDEIRNQIDGRVIRPGRGGWNVRIVGGWSIGERGMPVVLLEFHKWAGGDDRPRTLEYFEHPLTSGEARTLARQLVVLADKVDLEE